MISENLTEYQKCLEERIGVSSSAIRMDSLLKVFKSFSVVQSPVDNKCIREAPLAEAQTTLGQLALLYQRGRTMLRVCH